MGAFEKQTPIAGRQGHPFALAGKIALWFSAFGLLASHCVLCAPVATNSTGAWNVVILHGMNPSIPASRILDQSMREVMNSGVHRLVQYFPESLEALRIPDYDGPELRAYLKRKYRNIRIDLVLTDPHFSRKEQSSGSCLTGRVRDAPPAP